MGLEFDRERDWQRSWWDCPLNCFNTEAYYHINAQKLWTNSHRTRSSSRSLLLFKSLSVTRTPSWLLVTQCTTYYYNSTGSWIISDSKLVVIVSNSAWPVSQSANWKTYRIISINLWFCGFLEINLTCSLFLSLSGIRRSIKRWTSAFYWVTSTVNFFYFTWYWRSYSYRGGWRINTFLSYKFNSYYDERCLYPLYVLDTRNIKIHKCTRQFKLTHTTPDNSVINSFNFVDLCPHTD